MMNDLQLIGDEITNFGELHDPSEPGEIRVVQMPAGEEIHFVLGAR